MPDTQDDDQKKTDSNKPAKKGKVVQPLHEDELKKKLSLDRELQTENADVLAELAKKTAELAEQVKGIDSPGNRLLNLPNAGEATQSGETNDAEELPAPAMRRHDSENPNPAADLIRDKLNKLFNSEPDAASEAAESVASKHRSKHQKFMYELTTSGKSLADIQTEWHNYYVELPNEEKHEVWQEFYANQTNISAFAKHTKEQNKQPDITTETPRHSAQHVFNTPDTQAQSRSSGKKQLHNKLSANGKLTARQHAKSALFGLSLAGTVGLIIALVFFNPVFVAPFISPSRNVSATPIIGQGEGEIGPESKIIIPKINLEVPVVYDLGTIAESSIQNALEDGVVHYAASPEPGELGNSVIVGHSSNNILNSGKYKFAFVLLKRLEKEDTFFIHKDGVRYTYKVYDSKIVPPTDVSVLGEADRPNTMTLITCDPPGTSINRLIILAEQITPDPAGNTAADIKIDTDNSEPLPGNAPSLWSRVWPF